MSESRLRILVVDDELPIRRFLRASLTAHDYGVLEAENGEAALTAVAAQHPDVVILDLGLPDLDGIEVTRRLREWTHIPIIILSVRGAEGDKIAALDAGADDYVTKPFDIDELGLRVMNTLRRVQQESLTDPRSGLPAARLVKEQIRRLMRAKGWACLAVRINEFNRFSERYPYPAGDLVIRGTARQIGAVVNEAGTPDDFVGQAGEVFVIITTEERGPALRDALAQRFAQEIGMHYDFADRQRGYMLLKDKDGVEQQVPLMSLNIRMVTDKDDPADIREII